MQALNRYFLALLPDSAARDALAAVPLPVGARAVQPQDLHLTLAFLGDLRELAPDRLLDALAGAAPGPVEVVLDTLQYWPGPRIACAVGDAPGPAALAVRLSERLEAFGYRADDRPFRSHVTLARKLRLPLPAAACLPQPIRWLSPDLVLMASAPETAGARYKQVAIQPFRA